ncbi:hypothetical protein LWI28_016796 [Acer negundo]|uniref:Uncharacterized protein n=1 Tax=Acer negundo TaxID=4023 RepID=A0AAD5NYA4_ACENE|nr:hypothetical protein LWI28_016796 [Acer negundo]
MLHRDTLPLLDHLRLNTCTFEGILLQSYENIASWGWGSTFVMLVEGHMQLRLHVYIYLRFRGSIRGLAHSSSFFISDALKCKILNSDAVPSG